jgi:hypothetical protein
MEEPMKDELTHIGSIVERVRTRKGITRTQARAKYNIDNAVVTRLEKHGLASPDTFNLYLAGFGLEKEERSLLGTLYDNCSRYQQKVREHEQRLASYRFAAVRDKAHPQLAELVAALEHVPYPAYIRDELWFIHAINWQLLALFGISEADLTGNWEGWQVIAVKFVEGSHFTRAHGKNAATYFPRSLKEFFVETAEIFFTAQMRALRNRLWELSDQYREWWSAITSLGAPFKQEPDLERVIQALGHTLVMDLAVKRETRVCFDTWPGVPYRLLVWSPRSEEAVHVVNQLAKDTRAGSIYYAADYIEDYNDWDEVKALRQQTGQDDYQLSATLHTSRLYPQPLYK